jgi:hypothetical protein
VSGSGSYVFSNPSFISGDTVSVVFDDGACL